MHICRYGQKEITGEPAETSSYWWAAGSGPQGGPARDVCHPECKKIGETLEAFEAQDIDRSCNYCRFFERGKSSTHQYRGNVHLSRVFRGQCVNPDSKYFSQEVSGPVGSLNPVQPECFENRRERPTNDPELIAIAQYNLCRMMLASGKSFVQENLHPIQKGILSIK